MPDRKRLRAELEYIAGAGGGVKRIVRRVLDDAADELPASR